MLQRNWLEEDLSDEERKLCAEVNISAIDVQYSTSLPELNSDQASQAGKRLVVLEKIDVNDLGEALDLLTTEHSHVAFLILSNVSTLIELSKIEHFCRNYAKFIIRMGISKYDIERLVLLIIYAHTVINDLFQRWTVQAKQRDGT